MTTSSAGFFEQHDLRTSLNARPCNDFVIYKNGLNFFLEKEIIETAVSSQGELNVAFSTPPKISDLPLCQHLCSLAINIKFLLVARLVLSN